MTEKISENRYISSHEIPRELDIDEKTVWNHLDMPGYRKLDLRVPHGFTKNVFNRVSIYDSLLKQSETGQFLKHLITRDGNKCREIRVFVKATRII